MHPDLGVPVDYKVSQLSPDEAAAIATEFRQTAPRTALVEVIMKALASRMDPLPSRVVIPRAHSLAARVEYRQLRRWCEQRTGTEPLPRFDFMRALVSAIDQAEAAV